MLRALIRRWRRFWCRHAWGIRVDSSYLRRGDGWLTLRQARKVSWICVRCGKTCHDELFRANLWLFLNREMVEQSLRETAQGLPFKATVDVEVGQLREVLRVTAPAESTQAERATPEGAMDGF